MKLTKEIKESETKTVWFCGCEMEKTSTVGYEAWEKGYEHQMVFNSDKFQNEYFCHKNKAVKIEKYIDIVS